MMCLFKNVILSTALFFFWLNVAHASGGLRVPPIDLIVACENGICKTGSVAVPECRRQYDYSCWTYSGFKDLEESSLNATLLSFLKNFDITPTNLNGVYVIKSNESIQDLKKVSESGSVEEFQKIKDKLLYKKLIYKVIALVIGALMIVLFLIKFLHRNKIQTV